MNLASKTSSFFVSNSTSLRTCGHSAALRQLFSEHLANKSNKYWTASLKFPSQTMSAHLLVGHNTTPLCDTDVHSLEPHCPSLLQTTRNLPLCHRKYQDFSIRPLQANVPGASKPQLTSQRSNKFCDRDSSFCILFNLLQ